MKTGRMKIGIVGGLCHLAAPLLDPADILAAAAVGRAMCTGRREEMFDFKRLSCKK